MLELKKGADILAKIGGIKTIGQAKTLFRKKSDPETLEKLHLITNEEVILKLANAVSMMEPESLFVNSGSEKDIETIKDLGIRKGEETPLAIKDHTIHFDLPEEQGRVIDKTFYILNEGDKGSTLANKYLRDDALEYIEEHMKGIAREMTLFLGFYSRGPLGAEASSPALKITTSTYVMHSANILYRNIYDRFDQEVSRKGFFFTNVHSQGLNRPEDFHRARVFMDRSWLTTFSMFFTYAGNTLLLKKGNHRFAVDIATFMKKGKELSEHMFITGVTGPEGRKTYIAGAAPSGCGKTTTAMVGSDFIGDDLAQLWIAEDGTLRGINPEKGIFGIVQDVNPEGDPWLIKCLREEGSEVIWSNVLVDKDKKPHWVGSGEDVPEKGVNYQGEWWKGKTDEKGNPVPISHPNARITLPNISIGNYNPEAGEDPGGVEIKVITYSGRDADTMPPLWVAKSPDHGVIIGASVLSEATATELGAKGIRRQPWANEPFIPGPLADYMDAQFAFFNSAKLIVKPVMAGLNYFLTHEARGGKGSGLLGEKRDVKVWLEWLERRANNDVEAIETPIGFIPMYEDLKDLFAGIGKDYGKDLYDRQFSFYVDNIIARIDLQEEAYRKEENIPEKLFEIYEEQKKGLLALKKKYGPVVAVEQIIEGV